jgi:hypothetical protein
MVWVHYFYELIPFGSSTRPFLNMLNNCHVRWGPYHHGMAHPHAVDGGDSLQIWRIATNILRSRQAQPTRGSPEYWGLGVGLTTPCHKK